MKFLKFHQKMQRKTSNTSQKNPLRTVLVSEFPQKEKRKKLFSLKKPKRRQKNMYMN